MNRRVSETPRQSLPPVKNRFGTFKGVFTPSILTILGVIMYLRFGWVVGEAGLLGTIAIVLLAHAVSFTTGLSICAIATNRTVKTGGDYYMISRSLGLPIGGALGIALFFALGFSTSLYVLGFTESFLNVTGIPPTPTAIRIVGTISCLLLTALTFFSTDLALKVQYIVLAAIGLSIVSLLMGGPDVPFRESPLQMWFHPDGASFETVFAVFFPAVTGFTAGVAMSGDLKDPRRSLPLGTIAAITVGLAVYLLIPLFLIFNVDATVLREDNMVWMRVARFAPLVTAGVFAATLSSALGSILGAPRYLQALAWDHIIPGFLGRGHGPSNEPRIGTIVTFLVAEAGILIGELDFIARIVTMFFLTGYGFLCLASGIQAWSGIASWRPDFRVPASVSFIGAAICFALMFKLDTIAMAGASAVMVLIFLAIKRREVAQNHRSVWSGFWAALVQKGILLLHRSPGDSSGWRPHTLVFGGDPQKYDHLLQLSRWLFHRRGLCTFVRIVEGTLDREHARAERLQVETAAAVEKVYAEMLTRVTVCDSTFNGIRHVAQSYGMPGMVPNTALLGWSSEEQHRAGFVRVLRDLLVLDLNLLLLSHKEGRGFGDRATVDIWWGGAGRNGPLMLLIASWLKSSDGWSRAQLRVNVIVNAADKEARAARLEDILARARVNATANLIVREEGKTPADIIAQTSKDADLTIIGIAPPGDENDDEFIERMNRFIKPLRTTLLVRAATRFDGEEVLYDD